MVGTCRTGWALWVVCTLGAFGCGDSKTGTAENGLPEALITSHEHGEEVLEAYTFPLAGEVTDADHDAGELTVTWWAGADLVCGPTAPETDGVTLCWVVLETGETEITLEVEDPDGGFGSASIELDAVETEAPGANITAPEESGVYYLDLPTDLVGQLYDEEDEPGDLVGWWESDRDGSLGGIVAPDEDGWVSGSALLTEGAHTLTLNVEDRSGKTGSDEVDIVVGPAGPAPTGGITRPEEGGALAEGEESELLGEADDVDIPETWLTASWESDVLGSLGLAEVDEDGVVSL
ncbi:MAG: hypothetical protein QGG40_17135, partial [Myxococcota bacterium]|nr:hypothetical protein [Myxococcota bacterium]